MFVCMDVAGAFSSVYLKTFGTNPLINYLAGGYVATIIVLTAMCFMVPEA